MSLKFTSINGLEGWYTCGCGGTPKTLERTKSDTEVIFTNIPSFGTNLTGENGAKYRVRPGLVQLGITSADAQSFVQQGIARFATDEDRKIYQGVAVTRV